MKSCFFFFLLIPLISFSQPITVGPGGDFATLEAAVQSISPGDTVVVLNGTYDDGTQFLENLHGTAQAPIVIMAETQHGAVFEGGTEAIHLIDCSHLALDGFRIREQTGNGINIDDGGDYSTPAHHIVVRNCLFEDIDASGNNDFLKLSGLDSFVVENCSFFSGAAGSGIDMVGCHYGVIQDCYFEDAGSSGIQAKGGSRYILIQRNDFRDIDQRAINIGGSTGLEFFRPPLPDPIVDAFEAADIDVFSNVFIGSWSPIAYVGCVGARVRNNTIYRPENWALRILQETTEPGFLACGDNEFSNNIVYLSADLTEVNIGPNTDPGSFGFSNNLWFNESGGGGWSPVLPVADPAQVVDDPLFVDPWMGFQLLPNSPCIGAGKVFPEPGTDFSGQAFLVPPSIGAIEGGQGPSAVTEAQEGEMSVFPNPGGDMLFVAGTGNSVKFRLANSSGITVMQGNGREIPIGHLPEGVYYLWVEGKGKAMKVVVGRR